MTTIFNLCSYTYYSRTILNLLSLWDNIYNTTTNISITSRTTVRFYSVHSCLINKTLLQLFFPAITICNQNQIKCSNLAARLGNCTDVQDERCIKLNFLNEIACIENNDDIYADTEQENVKEMNFSSKRQKREETLVETDIGFCQDCSVPSFLETEYMFLQLYMSISEEERILIGHSFVDMVKDCTFRGRDCKQERYIHIVWCFVANVF